MFTVQNGEMDFLDTVRRIANDVGTSDDVASGADVAHAKKELLLQCLEVLVKQSMMSTESAKIIFGKFVQGERSVSDAVDSCTKNSNIQAFLQTLCSLPDHFVENEIVDIIRSYPGISSDDVKILVDLVRTRDNKVVEVCHNFIENRDSAKLVSDLIAISQVDTEGPLLNVDAQKTVVEILKRANAISISQYTVLSEMISNGDHDLQDVFSVYEASRDVYALIDSLKNLCTEFENNDIQEPSNAESQFLHIVQSMNLSHLETSALRLAISRNDPAIRVAIDSFRDTLDEDSLKSALRSIAQNTIPFAVDGQEKDISEVATTVGRDVPSNSLITSQSARDHVFPILVSELVKEGILSARIGEAIMKQFSVGNPVIGAALDVYDRDNDMGQLVDTLQEFVEVLKMN